MCTVSFYSDDKKVVITSNRDEHSDRPLAIAPKQYLYNNTPLYFPKDPKAGGSWFVVKPDNAVFVLLNGAEQKHISNPPYDKSRGVILLEIASAHNLMEYWDCIDLLRIEPFTIIAFIQQKLFQLRWNGHLKELKMLDNKAPKIWSSSTLYNPDIMEQRAFWFSEFLSQNHKPIEARDLMNFHTTTQSNDIENGLLINRNTKIRTKSITQCILENNRIELLHADLINGFTTSIIVNNETLVA